jgi:trehalose-6-phosphate synthase
MKKMEQYDLLKLENKSLKEQVEHVSTELLQERNQDAQGLKEKLEHYESLLETMVQERVQKVTIELQSEFREKLTIYKEQEHSLQKQLSHIKDQFTSLQSNQEFTMATNYTSEYGLLHFI